MYPLQAVVLAAGKSTRLNTGTTKLLEKICGQEMILYSTVLLESLHIPAIVVVGFQKEAIIDLLKTKHPSLTFVDQQNLWGTGHAVLMTKDHWSAENLLILNSDIPLVQPDLIKQLYETHQSTQAALTFVTAHHSEPSDYGRVVGKDNHIRIIEAKEFTGDITEHCCINAGIYLVRRDFLQEHSNKIDNNNSKKEFYLTDLVKIATDHGHTVTTVTAPFDMVRGVNSFKELWAVEQIKRAELIGEGMDTGVRFSMPQTTHLDLHVVIGAGTQIGAGVQLRKGTTIGQRCSIGDYAVIENSQIADEVIIAPYTVIYDSIIAQGAHVGPSAHIRNGSVIGAHAIIGNFVEVKKSYIGANTKAKHLTYLGDAQIGKNVNIGAGTITCNHDGNTKNSTIIHDEAYIGSNNSLVAPVVIGKQAYTAAGSVITEDVPEQALAIARSRQINKEGYAAKLRKEIHKNSNSEPQSFTSST